jgi:uncharacterized membrane protein
MIGAVAGFVLSALVGALLLGLSLRMDRSERSDRRMGCSCLLRLAALLVLTFGLGLGFMLGRGLGLE